MLLLAAYCMCLFYGKWLSIGWLERVGLDGIPSRPSMSLHCHLIWIAGLHLVQNGLNQDRADNPFFDNPSSQHGNDCCRPGHRLAPPGKFIDQKFFEYFHNCIFNINNLWVSKGLNI